MCCALLTLVFLGPRFFGVIWWLLRPLTWAEAFAPWPGTPWWIWPLLGVIFLPWTTLIYIIIAPGGVIGFDWLWLILAFVADIASYGGGAGRRSIPGYEGY
jgi:hypothetical protein